MNVVTYARTAAEPQNGRLIDEQVPASEEWADHEGSTVVRIFRDRCVSGFANLDGTLRLGLAHMLARIREGGIDGVLVRSVHRFSRNHRDSDLIREQVELDGARQVTLDNGLTNPCDGFSFVDARA